MSNELKERYKGWVANQSSSLSSSSEGSLSVCPIDVQDEMERGLVKPAASRLKGWRGNGSGKGRRRETSHDGVPSLSSPLPPLLANLFPLLRKDGESIFGLPYPGYGFPVPTWRAPLPLCVFEEEVLRYDPEKFDFASAICEELLGLSLDGDNDGNGAPGSQCPRHLAASALLEGFQEGSMVSTWRPSARKGSDARDEKKRGDVNLSMCEKKEHGHSIDVPPSPSLSPAVSNADSWSMKVQRNHTLVKDCGRLCTLYEEFVRDIAAPAVLRAFFGPSFHFRLVQSEGAETGPFGAAHETEARREISSKEKEKRREERPFPSQVFLKASDEYHADATQEDFIHKPDDTEGSCLLAESTELPSSSSCSSSSCSTTCSRIVTVLFQSQPTVRVFCSEELPPSVSANGEAFPRGRFKSLGRLHNDAEYGHQPGEVNFWVPLTRCNPSNTMWVESVPGRADWRPLLLHPGEALRFHGTFCRHFTRCNCSGVTRVSLDFRLAIEESFDAQWTLGGSNHKHDRKALQFKIL
uniref:Uncharacterized protein n=1 Tax=Chromera velia CCMP2878 TaxID=1169474 RepID=A0A0G4I7W7_9ALVE|eukprot:Cvel_11791.t1-p1 / transcript=Cvel_11791.t1 / gene=Cvel_11791 / organism=Chromera_velia_CCMP2878 / gene_product=Streptomycin biosynthesis protein StrG, putative / transcript_product=Streptomycin biosynthesis protein StrG, putative / location=Cvel_scaffold750:18999-20964(-) / protein_length=523 / sequence_SO=supercontig / SO=protein_coding / is_pseudo=false